MLFGFHFIVIPRVGGVRKLDTTRLLAWYQEKLKAYSEIVSVTDLTTSWRDGVALCCLIHLYRPEMMLVEQNINW